MVMSNELRIAIYNDLASEAALSTNRILFNEDRCARIAQKHDVGYAETKCIWKRVRRDLVKCAKFNHNCPHIITYVIKI